jgi:hypothetical protein
MKPEFKSWKIPIAIRMIACSTIPIALLYFIDDIDSSASVWAFHHQTLPYLSSQFLACYKLGFILPVLTTLTAIWFATGKTVSVVRFSWVIVLLLVLHLLWIAWGVLAFYLANQKLVLF